jgi:fructosamine-3-kinase
VQVNVQERLLNEKIDPALSDWALSRLAGNALGEQVRVEGYTVLTGGCWNRVIGVEAGGTRLVFKISPHDRDQGILREFRVLEEFADLTDLPVPEPLYLDADGEYLPGTTLVMSRIPGAVMHECVGLLNYGQRRRIIREIADYVVALHSRTAQGFGGVELPGSEREKTWATFWLPRFDRVIRDAEEAGTVPREILAAAREMRPEFAALLADVHEPVMTHYDIWSGNVMVDVEEDPPRVTGFIDIPGFYADYARELSFAMLFGVADRNFMASYQRVYDLDAGFEVRAAVYNLKMNIKHIQMYPDQPYYQNGAVRCLQKIYAEL